MTDLERAQSVVNNFCGYEAGGRWQPLIDAVAAVLTAARREGVEAAVVKLKTEAVTEAERRGAAEMREQAATAVAEFGFTTAATYIRALPLKSDTPLILTSKKDGA